MYAYLTPAGEETLICEPRKGMTTVHSHTVPTRPQELNWSPKGNVHSVGRSDLRTYVSTSNALDGNRNALNAL